MGIKIGFQNIEAQKFVLVICEMFSYYLIENNQLFSHAN